jgi:hypothetical protein
MRRYRTLTHGRPVDAAIVGLLRKRAPGPAVFHGPFEEGVFLGIGVPTQSFPER